MIVSAQIERMPVADGRAGRTIPVKYGHLSREHTAVFRTRMVKAQYARGLSQRQLGRLAGVNQVTISNLYIGKTKMVQENIARRLATALKLKTNDIIQEVA